MIGVPLADPVAAPTACLGLLSRPQEALCPLAHMPVFYLTFAVCCWAALEAPVIAAPAADKRAYGGQSSIFPTPRVHVYFLS